MMLDAVESADHLLRKLPDASKVLHRLTDETDEASCASVGGCSGVEPC